MVEKFCKMGLSTFWRTDYGRQRHIEVCHQFLLCSRSRLSLLRVVIFLHDSPTLTA